MVNLGIAPAMTGKQLTQMLDSMSPKEKRVAKRKFRKIWRKFAKNNRSTAEFMGLGVSEPSKDHKRNRSTIISVEMVKSI